MGDALRVLVAAVYVDLLWPLCNMFRGCCACCWRGLLAPLLPLLF